MVQISTYVEPLFGLPPTTIVIDPEVIAPWPERACAKFPTFVQIPSLYSAIIDEEDEAFGYPPMIRTLSLVDAVA